MKEKKTDLLAIAISFVAACFTFFLYLSKYLSKNEQILNRIYERSGQLNIVAGRSGYFLYILYFVGLIFFLMLGFFIYKIIFKLVKVNINNAKLLLTVETAYAVTFLIGYIAIGFIPFVAIIILCNLIEMSMVVYMCMDEVRPQLFKVILCRSILIVLSLFVCF